MVRDFSIINSWKIKQLIGSILSGVILMGIFGAVLGGLMGLEKGDGVQSIDLSIILGFFLGFCGGINFGLYALIFRDFDRWDFFFHSKRYYQILINLNYGEIIKDRIYCSIYWAFYSAIIIFILYLILMAIAIFILIAFGLRRFDEIDFNTVIFLLKFFTFYGAILGAFLGIAGGRKPVG